MYAHANRDASLHYLNHEEYWMLDRLATSNTVNVTLGWNAATCGLPTTDSLKVAAYNGTTWKDLGHGTTTGNTTTGTVRTAAASTVYGPYALANYTTVSAIAGPDRVIEAGDTATIGIVENTPAWLYDWTPATYVLDADSAITSAWPTVKTQYILEVEAENGCTQQDTMMVYITTTPESEGTSSLDFAVNNGQLIDTEGNPRPDIGIYSHNASPMLYCRDNVLSFVHAKLDTVAATPDTLARVDIQFEDTYTEASPLGMGQNAHHYNYYLAHCPEGVTLTPSYNRVVYPELYDKTDLHIAGNNAWMKFEFVIHPDGDPEDIIMTFAGAEDVELIEETGQLVVTSSIGTYVFPRPAALKIDSVGDVVALGWQPNWTLSVTGDTARFTDIGAYDEEEVLVIKVGEEMVADIQHTDDNHEWQTSFGGVGLEEAMDVHTDSDGNSIFVGYTGTPTFPYVDGQVLFSNTSSGLLDAFIAKFENPEYTMTSDNRGDALIWATYFGGTEDDRANAVRTIGDEETGKIYVAGEAKNGLTTIGTGYTQSYSGNIDAFVAELNSFDGEVLWFTYIGGSEYEKATSLAIDNSGNLFVGGSTWSAASTTNCNVPTDEGFPMCELGGAYNQSSAGVENGFIMRFNPSNQMTWSTFLGGNAQTVLTSLHHDGDQLYAGGYTTGGSGFPVKNPDLSDTYYQTAYGGGLHDGFVAVFNSVLDDRWITLFGGSGDDRIHALVTSNGENPDLFITGITDSPDGAGSGDRCEVPPTGDFPLCDSGNGAHFWPEINQGNGAGYSDAFIARFTHSAELEWATYFGGWLDDGANGITFTSDLLGPLGNSEEGEFVMLCGATWSDDIPLSVPGSLFGNGGFMLYNVYSPGPGTNPAFGNSESFLQMFRAEGQGAWGTVYTENFGSQANYGNDRANAVHIHESAQVYLAGGMETGCLPIYHGMEAHFENPYVSAFSGAENAADALLTRFSFSALMMPVVDNVNDLNVEELYSLVYPNPNAGHFTVEWNALTSAVYTLTFFDAQGRSLQNRSGISVQGINLISIDMSHFSNGIFIGQLLQDVKPFSFKWIKQ
jgi:hypothetical protein